MSSSSSVAQTAKAREALAAKFPDEQARSAHFRSLGKRSGESRRASRDDAITVTIRPTHELSPTQRAAWRELWKSLLAEPAGGER